jgi:hypothetical protein
MMAVIIAVVGSAFTLKQSFKKTDTLYYFKYNQPTRTGLTTASNWTVADPQDVGCNSSEGVNCIIHMTQSPVGSNPDFSSAGITSDSQVDALTDSFKDQ